MLKRDLCLNCDTPLVNNGITTFCPKCESVIVDSKSAGFTKCSICHNYALDEKGWCYNGCNTKEK